MGSFKLDWQPAQDVKPIAKKLAEGEGTFFVRKAYTTDKEGHPLETKDGRPKINVQLTVKDKYGTEGTIYDSFTGATLWKILSICEAIGQPELYQPDFDYDAIIGCSGKLNIMLDDKGRNSVKNYIKMKEPKASKYATQEQEDELNGDLSVMDDLGDVPF